MKIALRSTLAVTISLCTFNIANNASAEILKPTFICPSAAQISTLTPTTPGGNNWILSNLPSISSWPDAGNEFDSYHGAYTQQEVTSYIHNIRFLGTNVTENKLGFPLTCYYVNNENKGWIRSMMFVKNYNNCYAIGRNIYCTPGTKA